MSIKKKHIGLMLLSLTPALVHATDNAAPDHSGIFIGPALDVGYDFGGQKIATVTFVDGSSQSIRSGEGAVIAGGFHIRPYRNSPFDLRATVGYKYEEITGSNADVDFNRFTYELMPSVRLPHGLWAGAGVDYQSDVTFRTHGFIQNADVHIKNPIGPHVELGWRSRTYRFVDFGFALAYTALQYRDDYGDHFQGNSIGLRANVNFGWTVFGNGPVSTPYPPVMPERAIEVVPPYAMSPPADSSQTPAGGGAQPVLDVGKTLLLEESRNLRWDPTASSYGSATLPAGTTVTLLRRVGDFWLVQAGEKTGWLSTVELQAATPVVDPMPAANPR